ncbi:MAG: Fpg/Nei family DNA glycosylase [Phycisphaerales bacterium]
MPELPDIAVYIDALAPRVIGRTLVSARIRTPSLLRTFEPPLESVIGARVRTIERVGKRIALGFERDRFLVIHLMIAGRLLWKPLGVKPKGKIDSAWLAFESRGALDGANVASDVAEGTLLLTEAGTRKRASLHVLEGRDALRGIDPGGIDPLGCTVRAFSAALTRESRTLKRILTSPALFSGIGNAYSDEILHAARLSPIKKSSSLTPDEIGRLFEATRSTLDLWTQRLRREFGLERGGPGRFPRAGEITAFRPDFAVHGRFGKPCPACGSTVQRIIRADSEINYCATCQNHGKLLADRSLSRLLKDDWPETIEEWELGEGFGAGR